MPDLTGTPELLTSIQAEVLALIPTYPVRIEREFLPPSHGVTIALIQLARRGLVSGGTVGLGFTRGAPPETVTTAEVIDL